MGFWSRHCLSADDAPPTPETTRTRKLPIAPANEKETNCKLLRFFTIPPSQAGRQQLQISSVQTSTECESQMGLIIFGLNGLVLKWAQIRRDFLQKYLFVCSLYSTRFSFYIHVTYVEEMFVQPDVLHCLEELDGTSARVAFSNQTFQSFCK